ncbi:MAG: Na/Pi cotransporter family protein [Clostridiales bacterium]|nr:Na/Pi cotransporter family protein [Clostridiales bacterium]
MDYTGMLVTFLGGLGLFLFGVSLMSSGLQKVSGNKMRKILAVLTKNRLVSTGVGALVTAVIQSSAATTVMVIGFINAGLLTLYQSVGIIMGANIGTTITGWLVSSAEWASFMQPLTIGPITVAIGAIIGIFFTKGTVKSVGEIIAGFGMLFMGIGFMTEGASPLQDLPAFAEMFATLGSNPVLGILAGAFVTAIIQSSSASIGILQSLASVGLVTWNSAVYIIMGQNIGTCVTAILSAIGASKNAKAAACIHLLFNVIGSVIFSIIAVLFFNFINRALGETVISTTEIALVHTGFNLLNTLVMFPFANLLVKMAEGVTSFIKAEEDEAALVHLDDRILKTPSIAIENCVKEIVRMGRISLDNLTLACDALFDHDNEKIEAVDSREGSIDTLQGGITKFMVKLCNASGISSSENKVVTALFHTVNDMERIGDYSENLIESAQFMMKEDLQFSDIQKEELRKMCDETIYCVTNALNALENNDYKSIEKTIKSEQEIDDMEAMYRKKHIERLASNSVDATTGISYLDTLTNLERVGDHALNVAQVVMKRFL